MYNSISQGDLTLLNATLNAKVPRGTTSSILVQTEESPAPQETEQDMEIEDDAIQGEGKEEVEEKEQDSTEVDDGWQVITRKGKKK